MPTIAVIEYGVGNIQSVVNTMRRMDFEPIVVSDGDALLETKPEFVILPGVGAMGHALEMLRARAFEDALNKIVREQGKPFLGICVGMQVLAETCEEFGEHAGLGWIPGRVRHMSNTGVELCLPHVGWNSIDATRADDPVAAALAGQDAYFLHSCGFECDPEFVLAHTEYGRPFVSMVRNDNVLGVQFHPEKSALVGEALFAAFLSS